MINPILVEVYRNNVLESFHRGVVCVVDKDNTIIYSQGDVQQICYPRSALKLIQVLPLLESGAAEHFGFTLQEIAIMCGSHNGEPQHQQVVNTILQKIGLDKNHLFCGPQYPTDRKTANQLIKDSEKPHHIHNNCSGKHAGFLAYCVFMGWPVNNYISPTHPAQIAIMQATAEMYQYSKENMVVALDGCSAPIFSMPIYNQAIGYKNLVYPIQFDVKRQKACALVIEAVSKYPYMVAGSNRYCTEMMQICAPQIIGKTGAEGIFCMGLTEEKIGVAIKIDDGEMLPQYNVAQRFIEATGIFTAEQLAPLKHFETNELKNFNQFVTGKICTTKNLFDDLQINYTP